MRERVRYASFQCPDGKCPDSRVRISMQFFTNGDRKVQWDAGSTHQRQWRSTDPWRGYTLFLKTVPEQHEAQGVTVARRGEEGAPDSEGASPPGF